MSLPSILFVGLRRANKTGISTILANKVLRTLDKIDKPHS